jgi:hypothetical protein
MKNKDFTSLVIGLFCPFLTFAQQLNSLDGQALTIDPISETSCPYLTKDTKGNIVMCWGKQINEKEAVLCFAIFNVKKGLFAETIEVPQSRGLQLHGENMPKIVFKPNKEIIVVWGVDNSSPQKKYAKIICYSQSFDQGKTWSKATSLVKDITGTSQAYFDTELLPNGEAAILWLDNRTKTTKQGSTLYFAVTKGKNGFQNEKSICETICQCCRTDLFIDSKGNVRATFRDIINDTIRDMVHLVSADEGKTFSSPKRISDDNWVISGCPHTGPALAENHNGLHFAWYTMGGGEGVFYCNSKDLGKTFSQRSNVSNKPSAKHPQIIALQTGGIAIVWDETVKKGGEYNVCVGLQMRTSDGEMISTKYITSDETVSEFPVIKAINNDMIIVAWVQKNRYEKNKSTQNAKHTYSKGEQVFYKIIHF